MTMTDEFKEELKIIIKDVVKEELDAHGHQCSLNLDTSEIKQINHAVGMMTDLGDGELRKGIELIRENHQYLAKQRMRNDRLHNVVYFTILTVVISGFARMAWVGFVELMHG